MSAITSVLYIPIGSITPDDKATLEQTLSTVAGGIGTLEFTSADESAMITEAIEARPTGAFSGSGDWVVDARIAASLAVPVVLFADASVSCLRAQRALEAVKAEGATVIGIASDAMKASDHEGTGLPVFALDDAEGIRAALVQPEPVIGPELFEYQLIERAREAGARIVLPEGDDDRILQAADVLLKRKVCDLIILGDPEAIAGREKELGLDLSGATIANPEGSDEESQAQAERFAQEFAELRKAKGVTIEQARETMKDISYYATMMIHLGLADGMVSGAAHTTAHTIRPAFQIIKTAPGSSVVSSIFLMVMRGHLWAFGDCAVNPNPTPQQLSEIAVASAKTAASFGIDPKVAMLSYSTGSSGAGEDVNRVVEAVAGAHELDSELAVDGPIQFDAAVVPSVGEKKMPGSAVAGHANVFVFPTLDAGNIAYKAVQRTAGALAVGPVLQGLNKPVNDLSRGATVPDIINTVAVTAVQTM